MEPAFEASLGSFGSVFPMLPDSAAWLEGQPVTLLQSLFQAEDPGKRGEECS